MNPRAGSTQTLHGTVTRRRRLELLKARPIDRIMMSQTLSNQRLGYSISLTRDTARSLLGGAKAYGVKERAKMSLKKPRAEKVL